MRLLCILVLLIFPLAGCSFDQRLPERQRFILTGTQPGMMVREITLRFLEAAGVFDIVLEPNDSRRADWLLEGRGENLHADLRDRDRPAAIVDIGFSLVDETSADLETIFQQIYAGGSTPRAANLGTSYAPWPAA
jgi:hypothetical protein